MDQHPNISWKAPEFEFSPKKPDWYWAVSLISISVTVVAFMFQNYLFGFLIFLSGVVMVYFGSHKPKILEVSIIEKGIRVDNILFPFESIQYFDIHEHENHSRLLLMTSRAFNPIIVIQIRDVENEDIYTLLNEKIEHVEMNEPGINKLFEMIGF